jgi:hypothetical protein
MAVAVAPRGLTFRRAIEIEHGRGAPPSERERAALASFYASPFAAYAERVVGAALARRAARDSRAPIVHVPPRRGNTARPREQRSRRRTTAPSRGDPDPEPPKPPVEELWRGLEAASVRMVQRCERRRAKLEAA